MIRDEHLETFLVTRLLLSLRVNKKTESPEVPEKKEARCIDHTDLQPPALDSP